MLTTEVNSFDNENFFDFLKDVIIKSIKEDKHLRVYSWSWSGNQDVFQLIMLHFNERLGDIAKIKKAPKRQSCGYEMRGVDINVLTDDMDLFCKRVNEMFNGQNKSYV